MNITEIISVSPINPAHGLKLNKLETKTSPKKGS